MIKNEHQYRVTQGEIERFESALAELERRPAKDMPALLHKGRQSALQSQLEDLRAEAREYEALRDGKRRPRPAASLEDLPRFLIQARIARGWTQQEFAAQCGLQEQQIQRYEANDYEQASFSRICELARVLGVDADLTSANLQSNAID
jgi:HTH-type transcriptional regulator/antitoxin HigA